MDDNKISAKVKSVKEILSQRLNIPIYQRAYSWTSDNVKALLQDISNSCRSEKTSYRIGSVILHKNKNHEYLDIVDGQQRITTILLILKVFNSDYGNNLCEKLEYNHIDSINNIRRNKIFIEEWFSDNGNINEFCNYLIGYCQFVEIVVADLSEAFQMFDTQNGRGMPLKAYNLLKAFHIHAMELETQETKIECDRRWESATNYSMQSSNHKKEDILQKIFDEQLYRTRVWSRKEVANKFSNQKISEFKGVSINKNNHIKHPFQNNLLLQSQIIADTLNELIRHRFSSGDSANVNPFVQINQKILNGKPFFDYVETYVEIYKQLFEVGTIGYFHKFYREFCLDYQGANRPGDGYLRELYKSLTFLVFDKYGDEGINKYHKVIYNIVYRLRLEHKHIKYMTVAKAPPTKWFFTIWQSNDYLDMDILIKESQTQFDCKKEVSKVIDFFKSEGKLNLLKPCDNISLDKYK